MKQLIYTIFAILLIGTSCSQKEEPLENKIDFSSPYALADNPLDSIAHHRYEIYKKYGVSVFFNDTVSRKFTGMSHYGDSLFLYETLDLNWSFSSHNKNSVQYFVTYNTDPSAQETALKFVDEFLATASEPLRPFSIFLPKTLKITQEGKADESPEFWNGFRTLVITKTETLKQEQIKDFTTNILRSIVVENVLKNEKVVSDFGQVSSENKYYGKDWYSDLKCTFDKAEPNGGWLWRPNRLWDPTWIANTIRNAWKSGIEDEEMYAAYRELVVREIGQFGFISGDVKYQLDHVSSPYNVTEDLTYYVTCMLQIGSEEFIKRYGMSPLVVKKYNILRNYIENVLKIEF